MWEDKVARGDFTQTLAKDVGFGEVYDFGGNDKFDLIEQFAFCWVNLAIKKNGRDLAFNFEKRKLYIVQKILSVFDSIRNSGVYAANYTSHKAND